MSDCKESWTVRCELSVDIGKKLVLCQIISLLFEKPAVLCSYPLASSSVSEFQYTWNGDEISIRQSAQIEQFFTVPSPGLERFSPVELPVRCHSTQIARTLRTMRHPLSSTGVCSTVSVPWGDGFQTITTPWILSRCAIIQSLPAF